ncbi:hypothetical protein DVH05_014694 [Phytophthora capsici]|nr:hypothetical protein DVH05_014694 [Phytophthora capsici]
MSSSSSSEDSYDSYNTDDETTDELDLGHLLDSDDDFDVRRKLGLEENVPGQVKSYALDGNVYVWRCEFEHGETEYLEVEELAQCVEKTALANYTIILTQN